MKMDCAHPACDCRHEVTDMVQVDDEYYCSGYCAAVDTDTDTCQCGHPGCDG